MTDVSIKENTRWAGWTQVGPEGIFVSIPHQFLLRKKTAAGNEAGNGEKQEEILS